MKTQIEIAREGTISSQMMAVAAEEHVSPDYVRQMVAEGKIVIPGNHSRKPRAVGIGKGLRTKVNASIGTSSDIIDYGAEVRKALAAQEAGADTLMELSVGGDLDRVRREVIAAVDLPVGNVPLYQAFCEAARKYGDPNKLDPEMLFDLIEKQCEDGMAFMAVHCGINLYTIERLKRQGYRYGGLVSKGGVSMVAWMMANRRENPLYEQFDRVTSILRKYDTVLSLGNGLRAGAIHDSSDRAQIQELLINCELAELGREMGCQMLVEGPGHVPLDEVEGNIQLQKRMSGGAPYYMLGPISTDVAPGFDHITAAIGAAQSSRYGADLICYITPAEHLALPNEEDVRQGVKAAKIAAYIGDMNKYPERGRERDKEMSKARRDLDWKKQFELALFPEDAKAIRASRTPEDEATCTMCGDFCASRGAGKLFAADLRGDKI
ncbi:thiamine biosynthesis protein ThiC [Geobacter metallireducens RCH3]|uniref:5-hydroxybenzimidazole synthase n=1 Tax=Geobacter metallireducens (strain ATCC 53774 / DSM 7210 / GS-15) TaxID=269799 RepID=BZAF_GEOMG|nr:phosphomethylpyrimidine synthase ThiC [Geobacter metallireducens]Q39YG0.1 RecName: Full=5-hydroxybenzimidazole synthase; Short=5-OHBza synthase; Short=HBI synthase [Geobacter metallireducens GS-15]ABB30714.1 4-amino-5-hydroxymethyl-2-methylpyrimidine-phosphate synthase [Geobacter metallireducens GS-15]EHP85521.1 thiamine biosynthesis protein ThiC [Geobacter metallireducens RCH3]